MSLNSQGAEPISFLARVLDLLSPRQCPGCGRRLSVTEKTVCNHCLQHAQPTHYLESPYDNMMARMFWGLVDIEKAVSLWYYEPQTELASLIHAIKYYDREDLAEDLGELLARKLLQTTFFDDIDVILPVPLSADRRRHRGYNQSECIAKGISKVVELPVYCEVLERVSFIGSQTQLNFIERRRNVEDAFRLHNEASVEGKHVLLVDDVMTTGATLLACATTLSTVPNVKISAVTLGFTKS